VTERTRSLLKSAVDDTKDAFSLVHLDGDLLASDPQRLADEAYTMALFGGRRCIHIEAGGKSFLPALEILLATPPEACRIVIEAGDLRKDAALRQVVSKVRNSVTMECRPDDSQSVERLIDEEMQVAGLSITPDGRDFLASLLGADRLTSRAEIAKLALYAHGRATVTEQDVAMVVADASSLAMDDAVYDAFDGDINAVTNSAVRVLVQADAGVLLGFALRHALLLHDCRIQIDRGVSLNSVLDRPGVRMPWTRKERLAKQVGAWKEFGLRSTCRDLAESAKRARLDSRLKSDIAMRALWRICESRRRQS